LNLVRSESVEIPSAFDKQGKPHSNCGYFPVKLNAYASMGNATTFPVETLVFWSLAVASTWVTKNPGKNAWPSEILKKVRVLQYGDDCILPSSAAPFYMELSSSLGLIVNAEKSHWLSSDGFRESCGGDYLHGRALAVVKPRRPRRLALSNLEPWLYTLLNRFCTKANEALGPNWHRYFEHTIWTFLYLFKNHVPGKFKLVPDWFSEDSGFCCDNNNPLLQYISEVDVPLQPLRVDMHGTCDFVYKSAVSEGDAYVHRPIGFARLLREIDGRVPKSWLALEPHTERYTLQELAHFDSLMTEELSQGLIKTKDKTKYAYIDAKSKTSHWLVPYLGRAK
jgi:hypothetical protein